MKMMMAFIATCFFSGFALAQTCPDFAEVNQVSSYECQTKSGNFDLKVSQKLVNNTTVYTFIDSISSYDFPTDGVEYRFDDKATRVSGFTKFTCEDNSLVAISETKIANKENEIIEKLELKQTFSLATLSSDIVVTSNSTRTQGSKVEVTSDEFNCIKK